jgi:hypothetical protein
MTLHKAAEPHRPPSGRASAAFPASLIPQHCPSIKRRGEFAQQNLKVAQAPAVRHSDRCDQGIPSCHEGTVPLRIEAGAREAPARSRLPWREAFDAECWEALRKPSRSLQPTRANARRCQDAGILGLSRRQGATQKVGWGAGARDVVNARRRAVPQSLRIRARPVPQRRSSCGPPDRGRRSACR